MYKDLKECRNCGDNHLMHVLPLGEMCLSGVFPEVDQEVERGPVDLVWCSNCNLLQLGQTYDLTAMYGDNYGYRSGLNKSMVTHLEEKVSYLEWCFGANKDDIVVDIGSNDCTLLKSYKSNCTKVGIDPTGNKFKEYYPANIDLIPDFFSAKLFKEKYGDRKAKIVTAIAMFYDLPNPRAFVRDIVEILDDEGILHLEFAYMPDMLRLTAYDAVCHEHLEFYSFTVVKDILRKCGMRVTFAEFNKVNGGSIAITACKCKASHLSNSGWLDNIIANEKEMGLNNTLVYWDFKMKVAKHKHDLVALLTKLKEEGKVVFGYGASTKGNIMLQYCGITSDLIPFIADVNPDKFGCTTPGTKIPIISEEDAKKHNPDYFLVFPWHFRKGILENNKDRKFKFIFPLPEIEIL
jgi:hypothetical protein